MVFFHRRNVDTGVGYEIHVIKKPPDIPPITIFFQIFSMCPCNQLIPGRTILDVVVPVQFIIHLLANTKYIRVRNEIA